MTQHSALSYLFDWLVEKLEDSNISLTNIKSSVHLNAVAMVSSVSRLQKISDFYYSSFVLCLLI